MIVDLLLPPRCAVCGVVGASPCPTCWRSLRPAPPVAAPAGLDALHALVAYEGVGRELVARLKYRNARTTLRWLAAGMAALLPGEVRAAGPVVTWAPTTPARRRHRGFDHAALLASAVARELGCPCRRLLRRAPGVAQTGRALRDRRADPGRFTRLPSPAADHIVIVDDVVTTGATLSSAARSLRTSPDVRIVGLAAALTPLKATQD